MKSIFMEESVCYAVDAVGRFPNAAYVWNEEQFKSVDPAKTDDHLLGLFQPSHMQ